MDEELQPILHELVETYGLVAPKILGVVKRGYSSDNFFIEDEGKKFFLKLYGRQRPLVVVQEIDTIERFFAQHGVPALTAIPNKRGETVSQGGGRFFGLLPYIEGRECHTLPSVEACRSMAEVLAHLHKASKEGVPFTVTRLQERWDKANFLASASEIRACIDAVATPTAYDHLAKELLELRMRLVEENNFTYSELNFAYDTLLHGDFHYHNMFFNEHDAVKYLFDFERGRMGTRESELGYAVIFNCFDNLNEVYDSIDERHFERARVFISTYRAAYPLADEQVRAGLQWYYYAHLHRTWPLEMHYISGNTRADNLVESRLKRLQFLSTHLPEVLDLAIAK